VPEAQSLVGGHARPITICSVGEGNRVDLARCGSETYRGICKKVDTKGVALNWLFRILRFRGDARAARRGPRAMAGRFGRRGV